MRNIRKVLDLIFVFLLAGAGLLAFFVILCGAKTTGVLAKFYWLKADTSGIPNASSETYWLNYMSCSKGNSSSDYVSCSGKQAAYPFSPRNNFGTTTNVPSKFVDDRNKYYYLSRVGWSMWLVGLLCLVICLIPMLVSLCLSVPLVFVASTLLVWSAWFYLALGASLWTSAFVLGKQAFNDDGRSAHLGVKLFAFIWTTVFIVTLCALWQPISGFLAKKYKNSIEKQNGEYEDDQYTKKGKATDLENGELNNVITSDSDSYINPKNSEYSATGNTTAATANTANYNNYYNKKATKSDIKGSGAVDNDSTAILNVPFQNKTAKEDIPSGDNTVKEGSTKYDVYDNSNNVPNSSGQIVNANVVSGTTVGPDSQTEVLATTKKIANEDGTVTDYYKKQYVNYAS
ncbi:hypothetical protein ACO0SA_001432 [Hanseniaspora valbyensis]